MKPSNKVLTVTLLLSALVIFVIPAAVNIKYSNERHAKDTTHVYRTLPPAKTILIKGISNCWIVPSDSFRIASSSEYMNEVLTLSSNDTLSLTLKGSEPLDSTEVTLYVPIDKVDLFISYSSKVKLRGQIRPNELPSYHFQLHGSALSLAPNRLRQFFNRVEVDGQENSSVVIPEYNHVTSLILKNINRTLISSLSQIADVKTIFDSKVKVQMIKSNGGTEIMANP